MNKILLGNCHEQLKTIDKHTVQTCVTSPPYWNLRDYENSEQLGLEKTPELYVQHLVDIFHQLKRVLRKDGTLWLNLGDTYFGAKGGHYSSDNSFTNDTTGSKYRMRMKAPERHPFLKTKDLVGIPWMAARALQRDGWYLRNDIIWNKPNSMPEAVKDRCVKSHEHLFLFAHPNSKGKYYFDYEAIQEEINMKYISRYFAKNNVKERKDYGREEYTLSSENQDKFYEKWREKIEAGQTPKRNKRDVWEITTSSYGGKHFAVFPPKLVLPCITAGSRKGDTVIDVFAGSGTTCQVAQELGRKWIAIELNPDYVELIKKRTAQQQLF